MANFSIDGVGGLYESSSSLERNENDLLELPTWFCCILIAKLLLDLNWLTSTNFFWGVLKMEMWSNISEQYQSWTFHGSSTTKLKNAYLKADMESDDAPSQCFLMDEISALERCCWCVWKNTVNERRKSKGSRTKAAATGNSNMLRIC